MHLTFRSILIYYPHPSTFDTDTRRRTVLTADFLAVAARDQHSGFNPTKTRIRTSCCAHRRHSCAPNSSCWGSLHLLYVWPCRTSSVLAFKCPADPYLTSVPVSLPLIGQVHKHNYQPYRTVHNRIQMLQTTSDCHTVFSILYTHLQPFLGTWTCFWRLTRVSNRFQVPGIIFNRYHTLSIPCTRFQQKRPFTTVLTTKDTFSNIPTHIWPFSNVFFGHQDSISNTTTFSDAFVTISKRFQRFLTV